MGLVSDQEGKKRFSNLSRKIKAFLREEKALLRTGSVSDLVTVGGVGLHEGGAEGQDGGACKVQGTAKNAG